MEAAGGWAAPADLANPEAEADRRAVERQLLIARRELRWLLASGELWLTPNQYRSLCASGRLDAVTRSARRYALRRLRPWLLAIRERLRPWMATRGEPRSELQAAAAHALLEAVGFFEADVARLVEDRRARRRRVSTTARRGRCGTRRSRQFLSGGALLQHLRRTTGRHRAAGPPTPR